MVAARNRGLGREGSVNDSWAAPARVGRARRVTVRRCRAGAGPRGRGAAGRHRGGSVSGTAGVSAPSCAPPREPAGPLEAVGREPARAEPGAELHGHRSEPLHHRLERLEPPLALDRLLEGRPRPPGAERARVLAAGQPLRLDALGPGPLEQPRGGQRRELSQVQIPQRTRRVARASGSVRRVSGAVASAAASPSGSTTDARAEAGGDQRARRPAATPTRIERPAAKAASRSRSPSRARRRRALEPRGIEIDASLCIFDARRMGERDLEQCARRDERRGLGEQAGDAGHAPMLQLSRGQSSRVQLIVQRPSPPHPSPPHPSP